MVTGGNKVVSINDIMKSWRVWALWRYEEKVNRKGEKRPDKVPYQRSGGHAKSDDPKTWESHDVISKVWRGNKKRYDGISLALSNGLCGIDIDGDKDTGRENPLAEEILKLFSGTYVEKTPSGCGYHILFFATPPEVADEETGELLPLDSVYYVNNQGKLLEQYVAGINNKFFTFTGNKLPEAPDTIADKTDAFRVFLDRYMRKPRLDTTNTEDEGSVKFDLSTPEGEPAVLERIEAARQSRKTGEKFRALYDRGEWEGEYGSQSEADIWLCGRLAYYLDKDPEAIDWAFRESALYREKWEREDYSSGTIKKAIARCKGTYSEGRVAANDFRAALHHFKNGKPSKPYDLEIRDYIKQHYSYFFMGGVPYIYQPEKGYYKQDLTETVLKSIITGLIYPVFATAQTVNALYLFLKIDAERQRNFEQCNQYPSHWIVFKNGCYDAKTGEMHEHSPEHYALNSIPHEFHPEKPSPAASIVDEWLDHVAPDEQDREMFLRYCGYCLTRDTRQQYFLILTGPGGNGKSVILQVLEALVGAENRSAVPLEHMGKQFAIAGLFGKLLNSCGDIKAGVLDDATIIKQIAGEDTIRVEYKKKDAFFPKLYAKLIFSANDIPLVPNERSDGYWRKLLVLRINKPPENPRPDFTEHLLTHSAYFLRLCVEALGRMYADGRIKASDNSIAEVQALRNESDTTQCFINEHCIKGLERSVLRSDLYPAYAAYCSFEKRTALGKHTFFKTLRSKGFSEIKSNGVMVVKGLALSDEPLLS